MENTIIDDPNEQELEVAEPEDFLIQRDEDGDLAPVYGKLPGRDKVIEFSPWPEGTINKYFPASMDINQITNDQAAAILNEHLVTPTPEDLASDGNRITSEDIAEGFRGFTVNPVLMTMADASGYDMFLSANYNEDAMEQVVDQFLSEAMGSKDGISDDD